MADIKQAALWIEQGERVVRRRWSSSEEERREHMSNVRNCGYEGLSGFLTEDLLADDWEIG